MKHTVVFCLALFSVCLSWAQDKNLNPTVSVTNEYSGKVIDADREAMRIEIPDSLYDFNLKFDYSGFEKQYRGNDGFDPYYTELAISKRQLPYRKFYMKAGAGYTLHPVFDLAWSVNPEDRCRVGVYASHKSYYGDYHKMFLVPSLMEGERTFKGYDSKSAAGVNARMDWEKLFLSMSVSYDGVHTGERFGGDPDERGYNSMSAALRLKSNSLEGISAWKYGLYVKYSYGFDNTGSTAFSDFPKEQNVEYNAELSTVFGRSAAELLSSGYFAFGKAMESYIGYSVSLTPRYIYNGSGVYLCAGLNLLYAGGDNVAGTLNSKGEDERFAVWPSLKFRWDLVPGKLELFTDADMNSSTFGMRGKAMKYHFSLFESNHYIIKTSTAKLGFRGNIAEKVKWKLGAAYERIQNADVPVVSYAGGNVLCPVLSLLHENNLEDFNFTFDMNARFGAFRLDGNVRYAMYLNKAQTPVLPSPLTAKLEAGYEFLKKADVFVGADYRSSYSISEGEYCGLYVPGYKVPYIVNLYGGARLSVSRILSVFVEGDNLLNRQCQYIPGIAEKGFSVTGGVVLNF